MLPAQPALGRGIDGPRGGESDHGSAWPGLVLDAKRGMVFAATARRGQNLPDSVPANLTTPGTPRALVWVFNATNLGPTLGGEPETIIELFGDTPRALAGLPEALPAGSRDRLHRHPARRSGTGRHR